MGMKLHRATSRSSLNIYYNQTVGLVSPKERLRNAKGKIAPTPSLASHRGNRELGSNANPTYAAKYYKIQPQLLGEAGAGS
jgi:hypothetical protein